MLALAFGAALALALPRDGSADDASAGVRYHFYKPGIERHRQLSPVVRRDLRRPSVPGNRRLLANPDSPVSGVDLGKARRYERNIDQAIRRLERSRGARDGRTNRRLRVLRGEHRRISRGLNRAD